MEYYSLTCKTCVFALALIEICNAVVTHKELWTLSLQQNMSISSKVRCLETLL